ncbi:MAG: signal peptidase I [Candidatus Bathyarchaeia archaeon]
MAASKLRRLWRNDFVQTAAIIGLIVAIVLGLFFGAQLVLNTPYPTLTVETGSMCIPYDSYCDGWSHPFERTLHVGDLLIVQGVDPATLNTDYPNSDVIVFHEPGNPNRLIVHRIVAVQDINGTLYFQTKGDGNSGPTYLWPAIPPVSEYDMWSGGHGVPENQVVGKVIGRIPWVGLITLFLRHNPYGFPLIIALILLLLIVEFVLPVIKKKIVQQKTPQQAA